MMVRDNEGPLRVMIAGIGPGSLGMELVKCCRLVGNVSVLGSDVDPQAVSFGVRLFDETVHIEYSDPTSYVSSLSEVCQRLDIDFLFPGAEVVNRLVSHHQDEFRAFGCLPVVNSKRVYEICSDKVETCNALKRAGAAAPRSIRINRGHQSSESLFGGPTVVKPVVDSGGSNLVFLAENLYETEFFTSYLHSRGHDACVQEYLDSEDEFTVGVLSDADGRILSSVAMRRDLSSKLSRSTSYEGRVLSSGWSQGRIEEFRTIRAQAERVAVDLGSRGPLNIQGRLIDGRFIPFEINPRLSGTSYFRALAGVNEVAIILGRAGSETSIRAGSFRRVLSEEYIFDSTSPL